MMISVYGWKSPFFFLGGMGILAMVALAIVLPADERTSLRKCHDSLNLWKAWYLLARERAPLGALGFAFLASVANDNLFVVYGAWLERSFGISVMVLGLGTTLIGTAELLGEGLTASFADRIGLKRSVIFGLALSSASYGVLPLLGKTISLSLTLLFFVFFIFEFTVVTTLSLCTELLPESRATMMSGFFAAAGLGRVVGALIGVPLWLFGGIVATGFASAAISGLAFVSLTWGLRGWDRQPPDGAQPTERAALWVSRHEHANRSHE
jgi:predicted MFS family arabinose efflux permease